MNNSPTVNDAPVEVAPAKKSDQQTIDIVAIGCAIKDAALKGAKSSLAAGVYHVDTVVRIKGTIDKKPDTTSIVAQSAEPWTLLAVALAKLNGVTLAKLVAEADTLTDKQVEEFKAKVSDEFKTLKEGTRKTVSGKTLATLEVTIGKPL